MASGRGYDGPVTPVVEPFTKEQRQRLEGVTFARKLRGQGAPLNEWLSLADYIVTGATPWNPHDC